MVSACLLANKVYLSGVQKVTEMTVNLADDDAEAG